MGKAVRFFGLGILIAAATLLFGCSTLTVEEVLFGYTVPVEAGPGGDAAPLTMEELAALTPIQRKLVEGAYSVLGRDRLVVRGRRFAMDCMGVVLAVYWYAGVDLAREMNGYAGNGVARLHALLRDRNLLYETVHPVPGDVIFWDDTYDRNRDGLWNDPLTHTGMVVRSEPDGTVEYVHANYHQGIVLERMNLLEPGTASKRVGGRVRVLNSPIRMRQAGRLHPPRWLAGQLFRDAGAAWQGSF